MKQTILDKVNHKSGETVPEGYFDSFKAAMKAQLPDRQWEYEGDREAAADAQGRPSWWIKARPYVYMAAMFAGVWLMMNMFTLFQPRVDTSLDNNPELLSALSNDAFVTDFLVPSVDDYDLYDNLYSEGFTPADLEQ